MTPFLHRHGTHCSSEYWILLGDVLKLICLPSKVMIGTPYRLVVWSRAIGGNETISGLLIALLLLTFSRIDPHYRPQQSSPESRATRSYKLLTKEHEKSPSANWNFVPIMYSNNSAYSYLADSTNYLIYFEFGKNFLDIWDLDPFLLLLFLWHIAT